MVCNNPSRTEAIESFAPTARQAKSRRRATDIHFFRDIEFDDQAEGAKEWGIPYASECPAREACRWEGELASIFALQFRACFEANGGYPGAPSGAGWENETVARRALYKLLFRWGIEHRVALPAHTDCPDEDFTPSDARELVNRPDGLYQLLSDCIATMKSVLAGPPRDAAPLNLEIVVDQIQEAGMNIAARAWELTIQPAMKRQRPVRRHGVAWVGFSELPLASPVRVGSLDRCDA